MDLGLEESVTYKHMNKIISNRRNLEQILEIQKHSVYVKRVLLFSFTRKEMRNKTETLHKSEKKPNNQRPLLIG